MVATGCPRIGLQAAAPGKARHRSACTLLLVVQTTVLIEIFRLPGGAAATAHPHSDHVSAAFDLDVQGVHYQSAASSVNLRNDTLQARVAILDAMVSTHSDRLARVQAAAGDSTATAAVSASLAAVEANTSSAAAWVALADAHALSGYVPYHRRAWLMRGTCSSLLAALNFGRMLWCVWDGVGRAVTQRARAAAW